MDNAGRSAWVISLPFYHYHELFTLPFEPKFKGEKQTELSTDPGTHPDRSIGGEEQNSPLMPSL